MNSLSQRMGKKTIELEHISKSFGDKKVIDYDVTNASKDYDAAITISCTESNKYLKITIIEKI